MTRRRPNRLRATIISLTAALALLAQGCGPGASFSRFDAATKDDAWREIVRRAATVETMQVEGVFLFSIPKGDYSLRGQVEYERDAGWNLAFFGPFGVKLGELFAGADFYTVNVFQNSYVDSGDLDQPLIVPDLDLELPRAEMLTRSLAPYAALDADGWRPIAERGEANVITLRRSDSGGFESVKLYLELAPLRVVREEWMTGDEILFSRDLTYEADSYLAYEIAINASKVKLLINYNLKTCVITKTELS